MSKKGLPVDPKLDFKVADMALAEWGRMEMQLSEREMPGLMSLIEKYKGEKPLAGLKVMGSLHMTIQTAMLIQTLYELGADIRWASCNIFSTQDHMERRESGGVLVVHRAGPDLARRLRSEPDCGRRR